MTIDYKAEVLKTYPNAKIKVSEFDSVVYITSGKKPRPCYNVISDGRVLDFAFKSENTAWRNVYLQIKMTAKLDKLKSKGYYEQDRL